MVYVGMDMYTIITCISQVLLCHGTENIKKKLFVCDSHVGVRTWNLGQMKKYLQITTVQAFNHHAPINK